MGNALTNAAEAGPRRPSGSRFDGSRHGTRQTTGHATWQLLTLLALPSLLRYAGVASSMALGTMLASAALILFMERARGAAARRNRRRDRRAATLLISGIVTLILVHFVVASIWLGTEPTRALASLLPLVTILAGAAVASRHFAQLPDRHFRLSLERLYLIFCGIAVLGATGFAPASAQEFSKPVFPFTEPSHFALAFGPVMMFMGVSCSGAKRLGVLLFGIAIAALLQNLTLVVICALVAAVSLRPRVVLTLAGLAALTLAAAKLDLSYFAERLDFSSENQNLSTLVYLQGWQVMFESWQRSNGIGLGFQQLGAQGSNVEAAELIYAILDDYLNLLDGGFNLAKVISEFGAFGLVLCLLFLRMAWLAAIHLRRVAGSSHGAEPAHTAVTFACCVVVSYLAELLVRGNGYFSPTGLLLASALWTIQRNRHAIGAAPQQRRPLRLAPN